MNTTQLNASSGRGSIDTNQSIGSIHHIPGNAPTASPEISGLTPMNTGSSIASTSIKRDPFNRNWFLSSSASTPNPVSPATGNQHTFDGRSASGSPAATSLNALSTVSDGAYQQTKRTNQQIIDLTNDQSPLSHSSSQSSVPSTQNHQKITHTNRIIKAFSSNGESSHQKQTINNNNKLMSNERKDNDDMQQQPVTSSKQQQKSSRRTTSLLNLFMSNSQGNEYDI